jgi:hypothetical protein
MISSHSTKPKCTPKENEELLLIYDVVRLNTDMDNFTISRKIFQKDPYCSWPPQDPTSAPSCHFPNLSHCFLLLASNYVVPATYELGMKSKLNLQPSHHLQNT